VKLAIILAALLAPLAAHAAPARDTIGFVDTTRVYATATEPVRLLGEVAADQQTKQGELNAAIWAMQKAKPAEQSVFREKAVAISKMNADDLKKHADQVDADLRKRVADVLVRLRSEHHLAQLSAGPGLILSPGVDLTDEAIKAMDATDVAAIADENARLKAKVAAMEAIAPKAQSSVTAKHPKGSIP